MDQQTVLMVVRHMLKTVAIFGVVESLVLDFPAAFGEKVKGLTADHLGRKVGQPIGFIHGAVGFSLPIANDPHGGPTQRLPGIKIVGIP